MKSLSAYVMPLAILVELVAVLMLSVSALPLFMTIRSGFFLSVAGLWQFWILLSLVPILFFTVYVLFGGASGFDKNENDPRLYCADWGTVNGE